MAISTSTLYLSFLLVLAPLLLQSLPATSADLTFVNTTCTNTPEPDFCVKTLLSDPQSLNISSVDGLAVIALNIAIKSAESSASLTAEWANSDKYAGLPEQEALEQCTNAYANAGWNLRDAQSDLPDKYFDYAENLASQAEDEGDNCENAFANLNIKSLTSEMSKTIKDQSGLCADIIDLLNVF